jgi:hypothetical protein
MTRPGSTTLDPGRGQRPPQAKWRSDVVGTMVVRISDTLLAGNPRAAAADPHKKKPNGIN